MKKVTVEIEEELHTRLRLLALKGDVSVQYIVAGLIHAWVTKREKEEA
jgi:predicted transcriptional regulator